jgi:2,5-dioxopentanoate dehydrogenase
VCSIFSYFNVEKYTTPMDIHGKNIIGYTLSSESSQTFQAFEPVNGTFLPDKFYSATESEVDKTMNLAEKAFPAYAALSAERRADFLIAITEEIMAVGDTLLQRAQQETGLPISRLAGERTRTITQITQFAELLREGSWVEASIDTAIPDRKPVPKPDIRKKLIPIGPVIVFGSSNFPFAYSVAGVDTAPALAAGNPVVIKAHPAHPGVCDLTAQAVVRAAQRTGMPDGVFSMLYDDGYEVGSALVKHPASKAVGFTGSTRGGMALHKLAQEREEPIAVFAEMGSVNPIVILPEHLKQNAKSLAVTIAASVTQGAGQFCTNPGLVFVTDTEGLALFKETYQNEIENTPPTTMLTAGICKNYYKLRDEIIHHEHVTKLATSNITSSHQTQSQASIASVKGEHFIEDPTLQEEVFGPFSVLIVCRDVDEIQKAVGSLKGQLTASLMGDPDEVKANPALLQTLSQKAGRLIMNSVPTGVEVVASMHHGGPFPSATDPRYTSVGRHSILRFVRPQSYQGWPDALLPPELQNANPLGILRLVNNETTNRTI